MEIKVLRFLEISTLELYDILQLRSEVFVVEQDCVYLDIDGKDQKALHLIGKINNQIVAYTRCFAPGDYFKQASIGRVVVKNNFRGAHYGDLIMEASLQAITTYYGLVSIKISAQTYLTSFYNKHGFKQVGTSYLEDGIPHIAMLRD